MTEPAVILCPGQGAQRVGMGRAWFDAAPIAAQTFGAADRILNTALGGHLSDLCFSGPADRLNSTRIAQPALYVSAVASFQALVGDDEPTIVAAAGLSLGEYTALHIAGALSFEDGLRLVALRGQAMQDAADALPGGMVALIGADEAQARDLCARVTVGRPDLVLVPANFNAPGQIVISGSAEACDRAVELAVGAGLRASRLPVAGAFHSPLMKPAADRLAEALAGVPIAEPRLPVLSNVTGEPHTGGAGDFADSVRAALVAQLTRPVRWDECGRWLAANVQGAYHELAPGKTLAGLMRRIDRSIKVISHDEPT